MDREYIIWGFVCKTCIPDMTDDQVRDICERHSDVFEIKEDKVNFTKEFLDETSKMDGLS